MNIKKYFIDFVLTFTIVLVVASFVTFLYSLVVHGQGIVDWETALRFTIILGITLPWLQQREKNNR